MLVVCISDNFAYSLYTPKTEPKKGCIYTPISSHICDYGMYAGEMVYEFEEFDAWYRQCHFVTICVEAISNKQLLIELNNIVKQYNDALNNIVKQYNDANLNNLISELTKRLNKKF